MVAVGGGKWYNGCGREESDMAMPESLIREWDQLSEQNRKQACSYISLLLKQQEKDQQRIHPRRTLGILADRFHSIADDFDNPLPDFEEYMS